MTGPSYVPRPGSMFFARLDGWLWLMSPLLTIAAPLAVGALLPHNVLKGYSGHLYLSLAVYCVPLIWAFWLAVNGRRTYGREWHLLNRTRQTTLQDRAELVNPVSALRDDHEKLIDPAHYFGAYATDQHGEELISERMVQQALRNARELRRDGDIATQLYLRDLAPSRNALRVPQVVALRLGILFSFIFLLVGLDPLATLQPGPDAFIKLVPTMVNGLTAAFTSSVGGIGAALVMQLLIVIVDRDYLIVARLLESTWMDLAHTLSQLRLKGDLPATVERLQTELATHRQELHDTKATIREQVQHAEELLEQNDARFAKHLQDTATTREALERLAESQRSRLDHLDKVAKAVGDYENRWGELFDKRLMEALARQDEALARHRAFQEQAWRAMNNSITETQANLTVEIKTAVSGESSVLNQSVQQLQQTLEKHGLQMRGTVDKLAEIANASSTAREQFLKVAAASPTRRRSAFFPMAGAVLATLIVVYTMLALLER